MKNEGIKKLISELVRFGIVGVLNTIIGTSIMFILYNLFHCNYWISSGCNYFFGSIFSYFANKKFTFKVEKTDKSNVFKFIINIVVCYLLAYGIAKPLIKYMFSSASKTFADNIAMLVGMCLFVLFNYFGQKFFVFKKKVAA